MKKIYLHPLPVRVWHWINAISFLILIVTGFQIRYHDMIQITSFKTACRHTQYIRVHHDIQLLYLAVLLFAFRKDQAIHA